MLNIIVLLEAFVIFTVGIGAGFYLRIGRCTIRDYERGLLFKSGKFARELGPGKHLIGWNGKVNIIDMRQDNYLVHQNILTSDHIHIGINVTIRTKVRDAHSAFTTSMNFQQDTHDIARSSIKETGRKARTKTILKNEDLFERRLTKRLGRRLETIGMQLINVELIDVTIPHSLQESIADQLDDLVNKSEKHKKVGF